MKKLTAVLCASSLLAVPAALAAGTGAMWGKTTSGTITVNAKVVATCTVDSPTLTFPNYDPTSGTDDTASANLTVTCTRNQHIQVGIDQGNAGAGNPRRLASVINGATNSDVLTYDIYQDAAFATLWTDIGSPGVLDTNASSTGLSGTVIPFYGKITAGQNVTADDYTDTLKVTVNY